MAGPWEQFKPAAAPPAAAGGAKPWEQFGVSPVQDDDAAQARAYVQAGDDRVKAEARSAGVQTGNDLAMFLPNVAAGTVRGAGSIGSTLLLPKDMVSDYMGGKGMSLESNRARRAGIDGGLGQLGADPTSSGYRAGKLAGEIAGTAGAGGVVANGARMLGAPAALTTAIATGGMRAGAGGGLANMGARALGGAISGAATAGLANPDDAVAGAAIGGFMPLGMMAAGGIGNATGRLMSGAPQTAEKIAQVRAARELGYVIPPTQAKPSFVNRALEGFSGKLTTAQNASARNQNVTNELAKKAIGAAELSPGGLAQVRQQANKAYENLGQVGMFQSDDAFAAALDAAGGATKTMRKNFPALANGEVDKLVKSLKKRGEFDAQATVEAIKQFRADASVNKATMDPAARAMGKVQSNIAGALEDLIDRNLQGTANASLLKEYRVARQVLAKTHDVEKALNQASGNIDAAKFAQLAQKGRPLTGELKQIANFAGAFPKAVQTVDKMGSLPGVSPLDFAALGTLSGVTANPALLAGVAARPAARALTLSNAVQNRLLPSDSGYLERLLRDQRTQQLMYQTAPLLGRD